MEATTNSECGCVCTCGSQQVGSHHPYPTGFMLAPDTLPWLVKVLIFTYKALYDWGCRYLKDHLPQYQPTHALHSGKEALLCVLLAD